MLIRVEHKVFKLCNVLGDGNCFFNGLVLSEHITIADPQDLRTYIVKKVQGSKEARALYHKVVGSAGKRRKTICEMVAKG